MSRKELARLSLPDEFSLIDRLQRYVPAHPDVHTGIGDDAAVLPGRRGMHTLLTTDMLVSGRHFFPDTDMYGLGRKALAVAGRQCERHRGHGRIPDLCRHLLGRT